MLDTKYKFIDLDLLLEAENEKIIFSLSDNETSDFFIRVKRAGVELDLSSYNLTLWICKPNKITKSKVLQYDSNLNCIYCNLENELKNIEGAYVAQLVVEDPTTKESKFTRSRFTYIVKSDVLSEIDETIIEENENVLSDILNRLTKLESVGVASSDIAYISPTTFAEFIEMTLELGLFYVLSRNINITWEDETYNVIGLYDVRSHSNGLNYYGFQKMHQFVVNSTSKEITSFSSFRVYIENQIANDVELDENNLLYLVRGGAKIGTGITLPTIAGENGKNVEFQNNGTYIQYRYEGDTDWNNLVALSALTGEEGIGIQSVEKTSTDGLVDTYTITRTDGTIAGTFTVINGSNASDTFVTTEIADGILTLTTDKYQTTTIADGTEITLPSASTFTEIHLFFSTDADLTLVLPSCKWQNGTVPTISANKVYEFIFTYTTEWLGGVIEYVA